MELLELKHFQKFEQDEVWLFVRQNLEDQIHMRHLALEEELDVVKIMRIQGEIKQLKALLSLDAQFLNELYQANVKEIEDARTESSGS